MKICALQILPVTVNCDVFVDMRTCSLWFVETNVMIASSRYPFCKIIYLSMLCTSCFKCSFHMFSLVRRYFLAASQNLTKFITRHNKTMRFQWHKFNRQIFWEIWLSFGPIGFCFTQFAINFARNWQMSLDAASSDAGNNKIIVHTFCIC